VPGKNDAAAIPSRWLLKTVVLVLVVGTFLAGLIFLGHWGLEQMRGQKRYLVPFAEIDCAAPPGLTRGEFLDEVQYLARLPDQVGLLDDELPRRLGEAFAQHPWVEKVEAVALKPPRHIHIRLSFRRPVLAVRTADALIAVDGQGVRLPKNAQAEGLPVYDGDALPPRGPAGTKWGDAKVEARAQELASRER
jgi:hypothetical protein